MNLEAAAIACIAVVALALFGFGTLWILCGVSLVIGVIMGFGTCVIVSLHDQTKSRREHSG